MELLLLEVNQVRELVGEEMQRILGGQISGFSTCAMERRPDPKYDFNNPLLETLLEQWQEAGVSEVVVSQFFLLPGRHAGPDGDLAEICQPFIEKGMKVYRTENLGAHPLVEQILLGPDSAGWGLVRQKASGNQENTNPQQNGSGQATDLHPFPNRSFSQAKSLSQPGDQNDGPESPARIDHIYLCGYPVAGNCGRHQHRLQCNHYPASPDPEYRPVDSAGK